MDHYVTGALIKELREKQRMTQGELADRLGVSDKTISKWETAKGLPDIALIEPLARVLGVSAQELMAGEYVTNSNKAGNMLKTKLYVCPVCGNIVHAVGEAGITCCGISLPVLCAEQADREHEVTIADMDGEHYVEIRHEMTKEHYISFVAHAVSDKFEIIKLYPEGGAHARLRLRGHGLLYYYCNRHGLFYKRI